MRFRATVELGGKTATGIEVPEDVVAALGSGNRPPVAVTIGGHTYRTTVARATCLTKTVESLREGKRTR
jgi:Domain of unknown function (DUF1905)